MATARTGGQAEKTANGAAQASKATKKAVEQTSDAAVEALQAGETVAAEMEDVLKAGADAAKGDVKKSIDLTRKGMDNAAKSYGEFTQLQQDMVEAMMASSFAATRGMQSVSERVFALMGASADAQGAALRAVSEAKSPKEAFDISNSHMSGQYDSVVAEMSKLSEAVMRMLHEVSDPISSSMSVAIDRMSKPLSH